MASPAWLHYLNVAGEPAPFENGRLVVHSDVLWDGLSSSFGIYPPSAHGVAPGPVCAGEAASEWRLLGVRVLHAKSHLDHTDAELAHAVFRSVTTEDAELWRIMGVHRVIHGDHTTGVREGVGPADYEAATRGAELPKMFGMGPLRPDQPPPRSVVRKLGLRGKADLDQGTFGADWVLQLSKCLGGVRGRFHKEAWLVRETDVEYETLFRERAAWGVDLRFTDEEIGNARAKAAPLAAASAAFWGPTMEGHADAP